MAVEKEEKDAIVELDEEEEGNLEASADYIFVRIGEAVPLKAENSSFDLQSPPAEPLAVSDRFQAIFVAHLEGFYVAKTKDVIETAKATTEKESSSCIQELAVVDVSIGKVHILALSMDSSTLAACVGCQIHFFSVSSLLNKEREPIFLCSLDESSHVKDFHWRKTLGDSYVVLSRHGVLYHGKVGGPLKELMDKVDAVDWSAKGNYIVVARGKTLTILSSKFRKQLSMLLMFNSLVNDSDQKSNIKVDSVKWIRHDCILLGCFKLTEDGEEDGYLVQIISCREGRITKASSKSVVLSFNDVFPGVIDDILPSGSGPYLFLTYLEQWGLAFAANRKNIDQHIVLFGWSLNEEQKEAAVIELSQEGRWLPRIGLQENEDENLIMGFGVDKVSLYEKVEVKLGVEERELSPYCILLCLTLEGKLLMFYVASVAENSVPSQLISEVSDEEDNARAAVPFGDDTSKTALSVEEHGFKGTVLDTVSQATIQQEVATKGDGEVLVENELQITKLDDCLKSSSIVDVVSDKGTSNNFNASFDKSLGLLLPLVSNMEQKAPSHLQSSKKDGQNDANLGPRSSVSGQQGSFMEKLPTNTSVHVSDSTNRAGTKSETQKHILSRQAVGLKTDLSTMPISSAAQSSFEVPSRSDEMFKYQFSGSIDLSSSKIGSSEPQCSVNDANLDPRSWVSGKQSSFMEKLPTNISSVRGFESANRSGSKSDTQKSVFSPQEVGLKTDSSTMAIPSTIQLNREVPFKSGEMNKEFSVSFDSAGSKIASSEPQSNRNLSTSDELKARSSFFPLTSEVNRLENYGPKVGNITNVPGSQSSSFDLLQRNVANTKELASYPQRYNYSSGRVTHSGQRFSAAGGKYDSAPAVHSSKISSHGSSIYGNSQNFKLQPVLENLRSPQSSSLLMAEPELSKHFGSVNDMVKELDTLLSYIEEEGGFRDACTVFQKSSVLALEQGLEDLSGRCRIFKNVLEDRHEEIQRLLDKTVQVLARKIYIESIFKQASDSQYRDLWYRQKLSPELELKQRQMRKVNQDLTNQLIQLEKHFNSLELSRFSESSGASIHHRAFHTGLESSRKNQSMHSLYNTMNSQLAAAEQLSECLSKQMALLNIKSPSVKKKGVTKELFESIGLDYDGDSFKSPIAKNIGHSPESVSKLHSCMSSAAITEQSGRHLSATKSSELETARRRRDSLEQCWANFEPSKTTVKRMLLQEDQMQIREHVTQKESFTSPLSQGFDHLSDHTTPHHFNSSFYKHELNRVPADHGESQSISLTSPAMQVTQRSNQSSLVSPPSSHSIFQDKVGNAWGSVIDQSSIEENFVGRSDSYKGQSVPFLKVIPDLQCETPSSHTPATSTSLPAQRGTSPMKSSTETSLGDTSNLKSGVSLTRATFLNNNPIMPENSFATPVKSHHSPFLPVSTPPVVTLDGSIFQLGSVTSKAHGDVTVSASTFAPTIAVSSTLHSPVPIIPSLSTPSSSSSSMLFGGSVSRTKPPIDVSQMVPFTASSSSFSSSSISFPVSSSPFPALAPKDQVSPFPSSTSINIMPQIPPTKPEPGASPSIEPKLTAVQTDSKSFEGESDSKLDVKATSKASASQSKPPRDEFSSISAISVTSALASKSSASLASGSQPSFTNAFSAESIVSSNSQPQLPSAARVQLPECLSSCGVAPDGKNETLDLADAQEDEMEEEAPDTASGLNLGSLSGFGLGSVPTSSASKPNPFGGTFQNAASNPTSPFTLTVPSGEMFRPASFSFQPVQPSQPSLTVNQSAFSSGFNTVSSVPTPAGSVFGQPAHLGPGQQALGSVLGAFGQSRQLGSGIQGTGFASSSGFGGFSAAAKSGGGSGFGGGFGAPSTGGFANAATGGGFAGVAPTSGGFAGAASGLTGFAGAASSGGFGGAAASGGFGTFSNKQGSGGFSAFGSSTAGSGKPPSELITQIRR